MTGPYDLYDYSSATVGVGLHLSASDLVIPDRRARGLPAQSSTTPRRSSGTSLTLPNAIAESRGHPPPSRRSWNNRDRPFLLESRLRDLGARFEAADNWADHVVVDRRLVTGQNPQSSGSAAREVIRLLS